MTEPQPGELTPADLAAVGRVYPAGRLRALRDALEAGGEENDALRAAIGRPSLLVHGDRVIRVDVGALLDGMPAELCCTLLPSPTMESGPIVSLGPREGSRDSDQA